ncbi:MAG: DNA polymerase III subunit delta', partial [Clostridia bacterium]|nr:DNA polymerase III subunit delta' [Clostridia bacterium]
SGQFVHAYLFFGPGGVGKRTLAKLCVGTLYCQGSRKTSPCGACVECRRIAHGNHPDVFTIRPERSIGVEAIRTLIGDLQMRAFGAGHKAVVIEQADRMTHQAQNCLLRTLEDPTPGTVFLLTTDSLETTLPTLRSRCRLAPIAPLPDEAVERRLIAHGVPADRAAQLAGLSQGSVGRALRMQEDEGYWPLRERLLRALFEQTGSTALQAAAEFKEERARGDQVLEIAETALSDAVRAAYEQPDHAWRGYPDGWLAFARRAPMGAKLRLMESAVRCKKMLTSNVSLQAVLETLMINIAEENAACRW